MAGVGDLRFLICDLRLFRRICYCLTVFGESYAFDISVIGVFWINHDG